MRKLGAGGKRGGSSLEGGGGGGRGGGAASPQCLLPHCLLSTVAPLPSAAVAMAGKECVAIGSDLRFGVQLQVRRPGLHPAATEGALPAVHLLCPA